MALTYKQKFNKKHGQPLDQSNTLPQIAKLSGYTLGSIRTVYNKGKGAFYSNPQSVRPSVSSATQWAYSRVYASVHPGSKSYNIDKVHLKRS